MATGMSIEGAFFPSSTATDMSSRLSYPRALDPLPLHGLGLRQVRSPSAGGRWCRTTLPTTAASSPERHRPLPRMVRREGSQRRPEAPRRESWRRHRRQREQGEDIAYGVIDPGAFAVVSGPCIGETFARHGRLFRRADNSRVSTPKRMGGWDQLRCRLRGDDDGDPMIFFFDHCRDAIRTLPMMQHRREPTRGPRHRRRGPCRR